MLEAGAGYGGHWGRQVTRALHHYRVLSAELARFNFSFTCWLRAEAGSSWEAVQSPGLEWTVTLAEEETAKQLSFSNGV